MPYSNLHYLLLISPVLTPWQIGVDHFDVSNPFVYLTPVWMERATRALSQTKSYELAQACATAEVSG